jgi:PAS domain S-box-containing protein
MRERLKSLDYPKELIVTLLSSKAGATGANFVIPLVFVIILFGEIPSYILLIWMILQTIVYMVRLKISNDVLVQVDTISDEKLNQNFRYYLYTIFLNSFLYGMLAFFVAYYVEEEVYFFIHFILISGIAAASIPTLSAIFHAVFIFIFNNFLFLFLAYIIFADTSFEYFLSLGSILFFIFTITSAYNNYLNMSNNIKRKEQLEEQNNNFLQLFNATVEAIVIFDFETFKILEANEAAFELFKVKDKNTIHDKSIYDFIPEDSKEKIIDSIQTNNQEVYESELLRSDGTILPVLIKSRSIVRNNKPARVSSIIDLSTIKEQEKQILQAEKMKQMGEMIGNIAHQWRQPLTTISIKATGSIVQKESGVLCDELFIKNMEAINDNVQYLSQTIDTFRNFIKGGSKKEKVTILKLIDDSVSLVESSLKNNYIEIINKISSEKSAQKELYLPQHEFTQVLINVLNNAKDALVQKKVDKPWIKLEHLFKEDCVTITIEDNAGGIPKDIISKIFDPYFTTKHKSQGTGLGLHMSYKIITESIGGKIYVENSDNGAKFFIEIPLNNTLCMK